jgi:hypothetical protein
MKLEFSRQIFEKSKNINFHQNMSSGNLLVPCGQTDRHDEANNRFCNSANTPKNCKKRTSHEANILVRCDGKYLSCGVK